MNDSDQNRTAVHHNAAERRFEISLDGQMAVADYELADGRVTFTHTFVPAEFRGRGLAGKLVRAGLDWARAGQKRVVPACSYVATFIDRHAEFRDLLTE